METKIDAKISNKTAENCHTKKAAKTAAPAQRSVLRDEGGLGIRGGYRALGALGADRKLKVFVMRAWIKL